MAVQEPDNAIVSTEPTARTPMTEPDELAIKLVALDGHRMKLKGEDRIAAIRLMAHHGILPQDMAWRLRLGVDHLQRLARNANITLPKKVVSAHWTFDYVFARNDERRRQELSAKAAQRSRDYRARKRRERESE